MKKILSTTLVRVFAVVCGLFSCTIISYAYYDEAIVADKGFYVYNAAYGKYLKNNAGGLSLVVNIEDASVWTFSGTSGKISMKNGDNYLKIVPPAGTGIQGFISGTPDENTPAEVSVGSGNATVTLSGNVNGYTMYSQGSYGFLGSTKWSYYLSYTNNAVNAVYRSSSTTDADKWKLVSKRQVDNTISLAPSSLTLDAIQGGEASTAMFYVNYGGNPTSISITDGTNTLTISSPAASQHAINVAYQVDGSGAQTFTLTDGNNAANKATFSFAAGSSATLGLTISTTAASGNAIDADKEPMTITGTVVTLDPQDIDWTQDFSALSLTTAPIALNAVAKTTGGVETGKTITYSLSSTGVVKIVNNVLYVLAEGTTTITAKVEKDATYVGAQKSLTINVSGVPNSAATITPGNASSTGIYTGTVGGPSLDYAFHRTKRQVDLQKCFDNAGQALFDTLYIFGMTMNTDGALESYTGTDGKQYTNVPIVNTPTAEVGCNASTPCYVYAKSGNTYVHTRTFDAVKTRYDWGNKQNGKHIYFTGYCPFAYVGTTKNENGWMYFVGGENETVDIYLDSCQIMSRYKTQSGKNAEYEKYILEVEVTKVGEGEGKVNICYLSGSSSPFLFTGTSTDEKAPFKPSIHIAGKNHLKGQLGSIINETHGNVDYIAQTTLNLGIGGVNTYSAPIAIKPLDVNCFTNLELTDIWKDNTITNGYLRLDATDVSETMAEKAYTVDLGSANGSLTINGGQYHLRNAAADGNYTCNMAVGYRRYKKTVAVTLAGSNLVVQAALYGFGDDITDSKVTINSGTFTMHKNMYEDPNVEYGCLGSDYYRDKVNFLDLRLPAGGGKSAINGGTFNGISNVSMCKSVISTGGHPKNSLGFPLVLKDVSATTVDGLANFDLTTMNKIDEFYDPSPYVTYNLVDDIEHVETGLMYGGQSANAYTKDGNSVVTLLLPTDLCGVEEFDETLVLQWATALPYLDAVKEIAGFSNSLTMCGPVEVLQSSTSEDLVYETKQLIYADFEGIEKVQYQVAASEAGLRIKEGALPRGQIDNVEQYQITRNINMLKVVQADTWYTFTAPFNVHEISVIEANNGTYQESTIATKSRADAMTLQAKANLHFWYGIYTLILPNDELRASSLTFNELLGQSSVLQNKIKLNHYNGEDNLMDAHYYLYELHPDSLVDGHISTNGTGTTLNIDWKPVATPAAGAPILTQGKVYAMQFPWCPMCNDLSRRDYYDYWSNKMILFYGAGGEHGQTIAGINSHSEIISNAWPTTGATATLAGNSTFADMTLVAADNAYVHKTASDYFERNNASYVVKPTEGFLLYNPGGNPMPARISRSGQIEYDENSETGVDGVPTVGDRTSLMLFGAYDGIEVLALHEQLVTVYNLQGNIIFQQYMTAGEQVYVATGAGIYVVRGESEAIKVMIE